MIVCFVAIASAVAGDIGHDYKSAKIVNTKAIDIVKVDLLTVIVAGLLIPFVLNMIINAYQGVLFTSVFPAPQAQLVANSLSGFSYPWAFYIGFIAAFIWIVIETFIEQETVIVPTSFGIGLFLGPALGIPIAIGGLISYLIDKKNAALYYPGLIVAVGVMGGESIAEFAAAALSLTGFPYPIGVLLGMFTALLGGAIVWWKRLNE